MTRGEVHESEFNQIYDSGEETESPIEIKANFRLIF